MSLEEVPSGRKKSSNFFIAPAVFAKSLACKTWVVECQDGPRICLATRRHAAVFPTPAGPARIRCGGFACTETLSKLVLIDSSIANSSKRRGAYVSSQDAIEKNTMEWVFQPLGWKRSLCVQDFMACSSQLDEDARTTCLACHCWLPLSFAITGKTLDSTTICTFVVNC